MTPTRSGLLTWTFLLWCGCATAPVQPPVEVEQPALAPAEVQIERLRNGLTLAFVDRPLLPQTTFAFYVDGGAVDDPADSRGRAQFALPMVWLGHGTLDEGEVQDAFDQIGGSGGASVGVEYALVYLNCLGSHATTGLDLLVGALTSAHLDDQMLERERKRALAVHAQCLHEPAYLAQETYVPAVLGQHPYVRGLTLADPLFLAQVTRKDVKTAVDQLLQPQRATLVVVGPPDDSLRSQVRERFERLPRGSQTMTPLPAPEHLPSTAGRVLHKVARPEMGQIYLRFGGLGLAQTDERRAAAQVFSRVVAGGFSSVLMDELRVNRGLVYGIGLSQAWLQAPSPYSFVTSTKAAQAEEVLNLTFERLRAVIDGAFTDSQPTAAKNTLLADTAAALETHQGVAFEVFRGLQDAGDPSLWQHDLVRIAAVTRSDVLAVARLFDPERMTIVAVGEEKALETLDAARIR